MNPANPATLDWVTRGNPEDWGERWIVAARAVRYFNARRASLWTFLCRCWVNYRHDRNRYEHRRRTVPLYDRPVTPPEPDLDPPPPHGDAMHLRGRGLTVRHAAVAMGIPEGTLKSTMHRERRTL